MKSTPIEIAWHSEPTRQTGLGLEMHRHIGSVGEIVADGMRVYGHVLYIMNPAHHGGHYTSHWTISVAMYDHKGSFVSNFPVRTNWPVDLTWQATRAFIATRLTERVASVLSVQHADRF